MNLRTYYVDMGIKLSNVSCNTAVTNLNNRKCEHEMNFTGFDRDENIIMEN